MLLHPLWMMVFQAPIKLPVDTIGEVLSAFMTVLVTQEELECFFLFFEAPDNQIVIPSQPIQIHRFKYIHFIQRGINALQIPSYFLKCTFEFQEPRPNIGEDTAIR